MLRSAVQQFAPTNNHILAGVFSALTGFTGENHLQTGFDLHLPQLPRYQTNNMNT